jgi:hypothetical protein
MYTAIETAAQNYAPNSWSHLRVRKIKVIIWDYMHLSIERSAAIRYILSSMASNGINQIPSIIPNPYRYLFSYPHLGSSSVDGSIGSICAVEFEFPIR